MSEKKKSKREVMAETGVLQSSFSNTNFVKWYPAYEIDKVKVAFVVKNSSGKGFDVFVDLDKFDLLCDDILSMALARKLAEEKSTPENKYPYSWEHVTGENGQKKIRISKGKKAGTVAVYGTNGGDSMTIPMSYDELRIMAKWFKRTSAARFETLTALTLEGMHKYRFEPAPEDEETPASVSETGKTERPVANDSNSDLAADEKMLSFATQEAVRHVKDSLYVVKALAGEERAEVDVYFNAESIESMGADKWERLKTSSAEKKWKLTAKVKENNGAYLVLQLAS